MRILKLTEETRKGLQENLLRRSPNSYKEYEERVDGIIGQIREKGDEALFSYTKQFDGAQVDSKNIRATREEIEEAYKLTDPKLVAVQATT